MVFVEKIGGSSMLHFSEVLNNILLKKHQKSQDGFYGRVFVVSAYGEVTNQLLEHKKSGEPGLFQTFSSGKNYLKAAKKLLEKLKTINKNLIPFKLEIDVANAFIEKRFATMLTYLDNMAKVLSSGYIQRENILLAAREILASVGEAHSAFNTANILNNHHINAQCIDLSGYEDARPLTINERLAEAVKGFDTKKYVQVVTGYTKGIEGIMREFDRGYSEVTFSKIAVMLKAKEAIIHKEFHLSSADPMIVGEKKSVPVCFTNFDVADQLADLGMEAIHPKSSKPLELADISIRVKNTFDPEHPGTLINKNYLAKKSKAEIVAGCKHVSAVEIRDPMMVGEVGFDYQILKLFKTYNVSYLLKASNANSITHVVYEKELLNKNFVDALKKEYKNITIKNLSIVCVIGSNIATPGILVKAAGALAKVGVNVECVSQSLRQVNMQFVVERKNYEKAIETLNLELCLKPTKNHKK